MSVHVVYYFFGANFFFAFVMLDDQIDDQTYVKLQISFLLILIQFSVLSL